MRWFEKKKPERPDIDPEILEARAAKQRAEEAIRKVHSQQGEVIQRVQSLEQRRRKNNFGRALEIAMEARQ